MSERNSVKRQKSPSPSPTEVSTDPKRARTISDIDNSILISFKNLMPTSAPPAGVKRPKSPSPSTEEGSPQPKRARTLYDEDITNILLEPFKNPLPVAPELTGRVFAFGTGDTGQLGLGDEIDERKKPTPLKFLDDKEVVDVVCGGMHTIAITKDGKVNELKKELWTWGCNDEGALGRSGQENQPSLVENLNNVKIVKAACGDSISMALSNKGKLYCWGTFRCSEGRLGFSETVDIQRVPALFEPLSDETTVDISAGSDHCLALTENGTVYTWGNGEQFQLGRSIEHCKKYGLIPRKVDLEHIKAVGCGAYHSVALSLDGELYAWGLNNYGQCGVLTSKNNEKAPHIVENPTIINQLQGGADGIKSMVGGEHHSIVLMANGDVYAFGRADSSQLGFPPTIEPIYEPTRIDRLSNIIQLDSGSYHAIAVDGDGDAFSWGFGEMLALGTGTEEDAPEPYLLTGKKLEGFIVLRVAAGAQHSLVLARQG